MSNKHANFTVRTKQPHYRDRQFESCATKWDWVVTGNGVSWDEDSANVLLHHIAAVKSINILHIRKLLLLASIN